MVDFKDIKFFDSKSKRLRSRKSKKHIERIQKSIKTLGYLEDNPIRITEDGYIVSGQLRYIACQGLKDENGKVIVEGLGIKPPYIVTRVSSYEQTLKLRLLQKAVTVEEMIEGFAKLGTTIPTYKSYKVLSDLSYEFGVTETIIAKILTVGISDNIIRKLKYGEFVIGTTNLQIDEYKDILSTVISSANRLKVKPANKCKYYQALALLMKNDIFNVDVFEDKVDMDELSAHLKEDTLINCSEYMQSVHDQSEASKKFFSFCFRK